MPGELGSVPSQFAEYQSLRRPALLKSRGATYRRARWAAICCAASARASWSFSGHASTSARSSFNAAIIQKILACWLSHAIDFEDDLLQFLTPQTPPADTPACRA